MSSRFEWSSPAVCTWQEDTSKPWFIYFVVTDTLSETSKRLQFRGTINRTKNKKERYSRAAALASYWLKQLKAGWTPWDDDLPVLQPRVNEAFDLIYKLKEVNCGPRTLESYRYVLKLFKGWIAKNRLDNLFIHQFEEYHARTFFDYLALQKGYAGRTYNDKITTLSTFANAMIDRDWISKSPFRKIKKVPVEIGRNTAFTETEKRDLKAHLMQHDKPMFFFTQIMYYCFIRRSELIRLKIENIDFKNKTIITPSAISKNRKQESVVIPTQLLPVLEEMNLESLPKEWFIFGRGMLPGIKQYTNYNHISTRHNRQSKKLGIDDSKGLYSWKHSGVCALYPQLNGDVYSLMRQLRHHDMNTTMIYLKSLGLLDNAAVRAANW